MKAEVRESDNFVEINFTPESIDEYSILLRLAINVKSEKPLVFTTFPAKGEPPHCYVTIAKKAPINQKNSTGNY